MKAKNQNERPSDDMIFKVYAESDVRDPQQFTPEYHRHPYCEIIFVEGGDCIFFDGSRAYGLKRGDIIFVPQGLSHMTRYPHGPCKKTSLFFRREDVTEDIVALLPGGEKFFGDLHILQIPELSFNRLNSLTADMDREDTIADRQSAPMKKAMLQQLFLTCSRECNILDDIPADIPSSDPQILKAAKYMNTSYAEKLSLEAIAAASGYSASYFSKKFRQVTGMSVHRYLMAVRMRKAALQLVSTDDSITMIALRCGFADSNYFKDAFRREFGQSPREYRKASRP